MGYDYDIIESVSEQVHNQWMDWSRAIASQESISQDRIDRWSKLWIDYSLLPESEKEKDRKYARKIIQAYHKENMKKGISECYIEN